MTESVDSFARIKKNEDSTIVFQCEGVNFCMSQEQFEIGFNGLFKKMKTAQPGSYYLNKEVTYSSCN